MQMLIDLPDVLLYIILTYITPSTETVSILCLKIAPLSVSIRKAVFSRSNLWSTILHEEYSNKQIINNNNKRRNNPCTAPKRVSKRLKSQNNIIAEVRTAHQLLKDRTEIAHYALSEIAHSKRTSLTLARLRWIFREYGPNLRVNHKCRVDGSTFLVECVRARFVSEGVIKQCLRELIERYSALPNYCTGNSSSSKGTGSITALCVASARGMSNVVKYLLQAGASAFIKGTGRFRLFANPSRSLHGEDLSPIEFAKKMKEVELLAGATLENLKDFDKIIRMLEVH